MEKARSTWQVYCFGKRNVLRLNLKEYGKVSLEKKGKAIQCIGAKGRKSAGTTVESIYYTIHNLQPAVFTSLQGCSSYWICTNQYNPYNFWQKIMYLVLQCFRRQDKMSPINASHLHLLQKKQKWWSAHFIAIWWFLLSPWTVTTDNIKSTNIIDLGHPLSYCGTRQWKGNKTHDTSFVICSSSQF